MALSTRRRSGAPTLSSFCPIRSVLLTEHGSANSRRKLASRRYTCTGRTWTLEEKLDLVTSRLRRGPLELIELILESQDRLEAVVTFVAVLELIRRSVIRVQQKERFGPIHVELREPAA